MTEREKRCKIPLGNTSHRKARNMKEEIRTMIAQQLNVDPALVKDDTDVIDELGADSLDVVELLMALEDRYEIAIPDEDVLKLKTVQDVESYIAQHQG